MKSKYYIFMIFVLVFIPAQPNAKYYQYVDENGVKHFTEDKGQIPDHSRKSTVEFTDKYDYMSDEEKKAAKQKERIEQEKLRERRKAELEKYRKKALLAEKKEQLKKIRTKVHISNNQILVPVTLKYNRETVTTTLLLDTGANTTVINDSVAAMLGVEDGKKSLARVAGGGIIKTRSIKVKSITLGPKTIGKSRIMVMDHQGPAERFSGLLGLDFLRNFDYTIDYENQYINWTR